MLGLIPSSEEGWATACACLKPDNGGWLHVHGNVTSSPHSATQSLIPTVSLGDNTVESSTIKHSSWYSWSNSVALRIMTILNDLHEEKQCWSVIVRHIQHVKSYAPHVDHLVVDLECRP